MPSNQQEALMSCGCCETDACVVCPPGTIYPFLVTISIPSLGVSVLAGNEFDELGDGETIFLYRWEGVEDGYDSQSFWGECEYGVVIRVVAGDEVCTASAATGEGDMIAVSCPPDPLVLIYTVRCADGSTLEVIIAE